MKDRHFAYAFIAPTVLTVLLVFIFPLAFSLWTSLHYDVLSQPDRRQFIGLENYVVLLNDPRFWNALTKSLLFFVGTVALTMILGLTVALMLDRDLGAFKWLKSVYLVPMVIPPVVVGIQWRFMLNADFGVVAYFAKLLGFEVGSWLTEPVSALIWVILVDVWYYTPVVILLFAAGLSAIPHDVREAARVDGATTPQMIRYVLLPLLKQVALVTLLIRTIGGLRAFDTLVVITDGGPGRATEVANLFAYRMAFQYFDMGKASALGWLMLLVALALSALYIRMMSTSASYR